MVWVRGSFSGYGHGILGVLLRGRPCGGTKLFYNIRGNLLDFRLHHSWYPRLFHSELASFIADSITAIFSDNLILLVKIFHRWTSRSIQEASVPFRALPESLHWLVAKGKTEQAQKWIIRAAKINKLKLSLDDKSLYLDPVSAAKKNTEPRTIFDIFRSPVLTAHTVILCYMW